MRAQKEDEKVELQNLEKEKAAMQELLDAVRSKKEKEQVASFAITLQTIKGGNVILGDFLG